MAKTHPSYTVNTTFTGKNIATAASVYEFTAAATARVQFTVKLTNAAGNGDYIVYLTHDWLGGAAASTVLPKTTCAAAAGETNIQFVSMSIDVAATDVVNVMIDGLAGDSSVNGAIRIVADNPSVFEATDTVSTVTTVTTLTGHTAQTGDAFARLGAPTGASVSADIAAIDAAVGAIGGGLAGSGAIETTVVVNDENGNPLDGVECWVTTDLAGSNVVAGTLSTDALGVVVFMLDAGAYYLWRQLSGVNFANPTAFTVA
jgi:hypothetical protein